MVGAAVAVGVVVGVVVAVAVGAAVAVVVAVAVAVGAAVAVVVAVGAAVGIVVVVVVGVAVGVGVVVGVMSAKKKDRCDRCGHDRAAHTDGCTKCSCWLFDEGPTRVHEMMSKLVAEGVAPPPPGRLPTVAEHNKKLADEFQRARAQFKARIFALLADVESRDIAPYVYSLAGNRTRLREQLRDTHNERNGTFAGLLCDHCGTEMWRAAGYCMSSPPRVRLDCPGCGWVTYTEAKR